MTVLSVIQDVSLKIGVKRPTQVFASTVREHLELAALARSTAKMIAYDSGRDWSKLKVLGTFTGTGAAGSFALPDDYERMLKKARMWPSASPSAPYTFYADSDAWLGTQVQSFMGVTGAYTIIGDEVHIRVGGSSSYLGNGNTAQFYYLTKKYAKDAGGTPKADFTADTDTFRLDEELLKLAMIYRWKQDNGQDYAEHLEDYNTALAMKSGNDKGSNIIVVGSQRLPSGVEYAFPGTIVP